MNSLRMPVSVTLLQRRGGGMAAYERCMARQLNGGSVAQNKRDWLFQRLAELLVDDAKHALDRLTRRVLTFPTGERFSHGVDEGDSAFGIGGSKRRHPDFGSTQDQRFQQHYPSHLRDFASL